MEDMLPYIDADAEISRENFIEPLFSAMLKNGGLYEYTDAFTMITMTADASLFSSRESWTVDGLYSLHSANLGLTMPALSNEYIADNIKSTFIKAATAEFIDRETNTCSFDSGVFAHWLALLAALPTERQNSDAGCIFNFESDFTGDVLDYPYAAEGVVAGFPETDGTGCYFALLDAPTLDGGTHTVDSATRIGIMAASANKNGAWRFVRALILGSGEGEYTGGIPVLKEKFESSVEAHVEGMREYVEKYGEKYGVENSFTAADAAAFRELVYGTTKLAYSDETLLDILEEQINAYLGGKGTAEDAAAQIQSRVSVYLAEQG